MNHFYIIQNNLLQHARDIMPVASIQVSELSMCNGNQDNNFDGRY